MFLSKKDKALIEKVIRLIEADVDGWEVHVDYYYTPPMIINADYDLEQGYKLRVRKNPGGFLDYEITVYYGSERIYRIKESDYPVFFGPKKKLIKAIRNNFIVKPKKTKEDEFFEKCVWGEDGKT